MKKWIAFAGLVAALNIPAQAAERNVLVEMFTNSHCGLCPPAHAALSAYGSQSPNAGKIRYIYYHVTFPYPDDPLAQANTVDASGRNHFYGPFSATPVTFFDGANQGSQYASWASSLDARVAVESPLTIDLEGTHFGGNVSVTATVQAEPSHSAGNLVIHFVIVEYVTYAGRNGVTPQKFVMRKMITGATGEALSIASGETKVLQKQSALTNVNEPLSSGVVVFVQDASTKEVLQSEYVSYAILTGVGEPGRPNEFRLEQNFPNPFNPATTIRYELADRTAVTLKIFNMLGQEVATIVNETQEAGSKVVDFNASFLASGVYFYRLTAGEFVATRKLVLSR